MKKNLDLTGKKFGMLTCVCIGEKDKSGKTQWNVFCECGAKKLVRLNDLRSNKVTSCGCKRIALSKKHGLHSHELYMTWYGMIERCRNSNHVGFLRYGGSGIDVCERWAESINNFIDDMGERPSKLHTLDRIDNTKGYSKENCRWATKKEQSRNRKDNVYVVYNGINILLKDLSELKNINYQVLHRRLFISGWDIEKSINEIVKTKNKETYA